MTGAAPPPGYAAAPPPGYAAAPPPGYAAPPPGAQPLNPSLISVMPGYGHMGMVPAGPLRPWTTGFLSCFSDCSSCCLGCWCPCILFGYNAQEIRGKEGCCEPCCIWYFVGLWLGFPCVYSGPMRTEMRMKYGLQEYPMHDCIMHLPWCASCALCQEARELKAIREGKINELVCCSSDD